MLFWNYIREEQGRRQNSNNIYTHEKPSHPHFSHPHFSLSALLYFFLKYFLQKILRIAKTKQNKTKQLRGENREKGDRERQGGDNFRVWRLRRTLALPFILHLKVLRSLSLALFRFVRLLSSSMLYGINDIWITLFFNKNWFFIFFCFGRSDSIGFTLVDHLFFWCFGLQIWIFFLCLGMKWWFWADKCCECFKTVFCSYDFDSVYRLTSSNLSWAQCLNMIKLRNFAIYIFLLLIKIESLCVCVFKISS